jgi:hypothetical protein
MRTCRYELVSNRTQSKGYELLTCSIPLLGINQVPVRFSLQMVSFWSRSKVIGLHLRLLLVLWARH